MATSPLSVSVSPLEAPPTSSFPKHCRPYALLVSARRRPPQVVCKRRSLVHHSLLGLRRNCHLTRDDPSSKRFYGFRIKADPQSGSSGTGDDERNTPEIKNKEVKKEEKKEDARTTQAMENEQVKKEEKDKEEKKEDARTTPDMKKEEVKKEEKDKEEKKEDARTTPAMKKEEVKKEEKKEDARTTPDMKKEEVKKEEKRKEEKKEEFDTKEKPAYVPGKKKEEFDTEEKLAAYLAQYVADLSEKYIKERGFFNVAFSGGSLFQFLRKLLKPPYEKRLEWSKWRVFWVDEKVLPRDHINSNYKVAFDNFLSRVPVLLRNVYAINDSLLDEGAADDYEGRLKHLVNTRAIEISSETECPKFDLMVLGMGPDGHVGSLFPRHALLNENKRWVAYMADSPKEPSKRITMTIPVINACDHVVLVACGGAQADAVAKSWAKTAPAVLPAQKISPEKEFLWLLDKDAASQLQKTASPS